ncbi:MAG: 50S ribosomal protein L13 [Patescibacteria group bacterium]
MSVSPKKKATPLIRKTHTIDASGQAVGRLATRIATLLRGKHKPTYQPHLDEGDRVEVTNAAGLKLTGAKLRQKKYHSYSGYPGGLKTKKASDIMKKNPGEILTRAVTQMLPPTRLRTGMMKRLHIK